jgi:hypothetical protein
MRLSAYMLPKDFVSNIMSAVVPPAGDIIWEKRYGTKGVPLNKYKIWKKAILDIAVKPMTASEIKDASGLPEGVIKLILNRMAFNRELLRIGAKSLRSNIISYISYEKWLGSKYKEPDSRKSLVWLAEKYLRAFGPARIKDFQWWAGITAGNAKTAMLETDCEKLDEDLLILKNDLKEFEKFKNYEKDVVDILPQWDSYTMGYAPDGRERFVAKDMQSRIYGMLGATGGNGLGTILINGLAHGSWDSKFTGTTMKVRLDMFEKKSSKLQKVITSGFEEISSLFSAKKLIFEKK